jgi:AcrR family transcriptional regulator
MPPRKTDSSTPLSTTRERVLAAAERLLGEGAAEFSMRDLATAAGVSFATPFNLFGSKLAIMRALSAQRIAAMHARLAVANLPDASADRVLEAVRIAVEVMLQTPAVNRTIMGVIGAPGSEPGETRERSQIFWAEALGDGIGLSPVSRKLGLLLLPDQLAIAFRGVLSFWTAGEIQDDELIANAQAVAAALLLGFVEERKVLTRLLRLRASTFQNA